MSGTLEPGDVVAGYRLERIIGQGGMGVVYEATQIYLERTVALKIIAPAISSDLGFRARFRREGLIQARLEHPNIVTVYEAGEFEGLSFLAMRFVRGTNLKEMVLRGELDAARSLRILGPIADALDSAHEAGLIHRDVKPQNVLVGGRDHPYLADFGLTKQTDANTSITRTGQFMGTFDYVSPEQIHGEPATGACDIYALGAVVFECLTGCVPFPKDSQAAVLYAHVSEAPPPVTESVRTLPPEIDAIVARAMAKEPSERYATARELIEEAVLAIGLTQVTAKELTSRSSADSADDADPPSLTIVPPVTGANSATTRYDSEAPAAADALKAVPKRAPTEVTDLTASQTEPEVRGGSSPVTTSAKTPQRATVLEPGAPTVHATDSVLGPALAGSPPTPRLRRPLLVGTLVVAAALALIGFLLGHSGTQGNASTGPSKAVTAGEVQLTAPTVWSEQPSQQSLPGLKFSRALALTDIKTGGVLIAGGLEGVEGRYLLPSGFLSQLESPPSHEDAVRLGTSSAYRYGDLRIKGFGKRVTLFVVPTTDGVVGVACVIPATGAKAFATRCEGVANTLQLEGTRALALGPDAAYGRVLATAVMQLVGAASAARSLAEAHSRKAQATLSLRLGHDYATSAETLSGATPRSDVAVINERLIKALSAASAAYSSMSRAASSGHRDAYETARHDAEREQDAIHSSLASLADTGYGS